MKAEILTPWVSETDSDGRLFNRCKLKIDHPSIQSWTDTTGQPAENLSPNPNMYVVEIACDQATLDGIEADANYHVQWSEA